jgi:hypothetical protein
MNKYVSLTNRETCDPSGGGFQAHWTYGQDQYMKPSAEFIVAAFKGQPLPKAPRTPADLGIGRGAKSAARRITEVPMAAV